jgi:nucleoside phosphorylase
VAHLCDSRSFHLNRVQIRKFGAYSITEEAVSELNGIQVAKGTIATGDSFMNDPKRVEPVRQPQLPSQPRTNPQIWRVRLQPASDHS